MKLEEDEYRGYVAHLEFGLVVWYRTTSSKAFARSGKTGKELRIGTKMNRVCTTATTYDEGKKQLDRKLTPVPNEDVVIRDPHQGKLQF